MGTDIDALLLRDEQQQRRDKERKETQLALVEKKDMLQREREARGLHNQQEKSYIKAKTQLTLQSGDHTHEKEMVGENFSDFVDRKNIELQDYKHRHALGEMERNAMSIRNMEEMVLAFKTRVTENDRSADRQQEQAILESQLRREELEHQKEQDILFMMMCQKLGLSSNGELSKQKVSDFIAEFMAEDKEKI